MGATALQIRAVQRSITADLWPLTAHIYHVMIILTGGFSKRSFFLLLLFFRNSYFLEILLNDLKLVLFLRRIFTRRNEWWFRCKIYLGMCIFTCLQLGWQNISLLFKIVKMNLTNSWRKKSQQLLDQSKHKLSTLSLNKFLSDQIEDGC